MLTDKEILEGLLRRRATLTSELEKVNLAISVFGGDDIILDQTANNEMTGVSDYNPAATIKEKIFFTLDKLKNASAEDIVKYLKVIEEGLNEDTLFKNVTLTASRLYRDRKLDAVKQGRRFIYSLPKLRQSSLLMALDELDKM